MQRYHVDALQARRVGALAFLLYGKLSESAKSGAPDESAPHLIAWAARLHEIGISVAYSGYHKHSAYIINHADMPGFSREEQNRLSLLVLAHRRSLKKTFEHIEGHINLKMVLAVRLAALFYRGRADIELPPLQAKLQDRKIRLAIELDWLMLNPLTATALRDEIREWDELGFEFKIPGLDNLETSPEFALAS
jgi:exopolyphosphatase/guanosine-5'-triphosphate,3'-diphosphate pyrophosphatase